MTSAACRAVRLDVGDPASGSLRNALQRADLVDHVAKQLFAGRLHVAAAEAHQVPVTDMRADGDAALDRCLHGAKDSGRIAGVETAGDVGAADDVEHGDVVAHGPRAKAFAQVAVQITSQLSPSQTRAVLEDWRLIVIKP